MSGSSKYQISGGQQGAVGDSSRAENFTQILNESDTEKYLDVLADELSKLKKSLDEYKSNPQYRSVVESVTAAETAAKNGDKSTALERLKGIGDWVLDVATKIGVSVAAAAIKEALGM